MSKINEVPSRILPAVLFFAAMLGYVGCNSNPTQDTSQNQPAQTEQSQDPAAAANLAPTTATQTSGTNDQQQPAQATQQNNQPAPDQTNSGDDYQAEDSSYGQPVLQATQAPPPLPEYSQPDCPGDGYLWTPGYWSYSPQGYYWVPGAWARPPEVGYLWTPGYWGFVGGMYR